jgi:hypothetical protein
MRDLNQLHYSGLLFDLLLSALRHDHGHAPAARAASLIVGGLLTARAVHAQPDGS